MIDWQAIIHEHGPSVWQTAYRLLGSRADADECMQEVFVAAVGIARRTEVHHWRALLNKLAVLRGMDALRRRSRSLPSQRHEQDVTDVAGREIPPDVAAQNGELTSRLRWALGRLPRRQAQVVCLRYLNELSYEEISQELGMTVQHVGMVLSRAREELRELLQIGGADHGF